MKTVKFLLAINLSCLLFIGFLPAVGLADTWVTSNITADEVWGPAEGPYHIQKDVQVYPGTTLTIHPGVEVIIDVGSSLIIGGALIARGTSAKPIIFRSNVTIPAPGQPAGIVFESMAAGAEYLGGGWPVFSYDYVNREVSLIYQSGSIIEHCVLSALPTAIEIKGHYPYIAKSLIAGCRSGIVVNRDYGFGAYMPADWFFLYRNTIEAFSGRAVSDTSYTSAFILLSGNIVRDAAARLNDSAIYIQGSYNNYAFLFNNRIVGNEGYGVGGNPNVLADSNVVDGNQGGLSFWGTTVLLHNSIQNNHCEAGFTSSAGCGVQLGYPIGPIGRAVLYNNTIQANQAFSGGIGDNIGIWGPGQVSVRHNNLGDSEGDMIDIAIAVPTSCGSAGTIVDARHNFWKNRNIDNLSANIYDSNDNFCSPGTVTYQPPLTSEVVSSKLAAAPILIAPVHNGVLAGSLTVSFSWQPVPGATRYLVLTNGWQDPGDSTYLRQLLEVQGATTAQITFSPATSYGQKYIDWFVVAGNDNGWSLPSEVRRVYFNTAATVVSGLILDENKSPVPNVYIGSRATGESMNLEGFSDGSGNYSTIPSDTAWCLGRRYGLRKEGFVPTDTFPRLIPTFSVARDLTIMSISGRDAVYGACGHLVDPAKGTVAGVVVNEGDQPLRGARVFLQPASGTVYYLDAGNTPDFSLSSTGPSGKFVIVNVSPGEYMVSADLPGYNFIPYNQCGSKDIGPTITVAQGSTVADALIARTGTGGKPGQYTLSAYTSGTGHGFITSSPSGIYCGSACSASYGSGTRVTLTASSSDDSTFTSWAGCDAVDGNTCTVTMSSNKSVNASFSLDYSRLDITLSGPGYGTVSSSPFGIYCRGNCSASIPSGSRVTLTGTADPGYYFTGWGPPCSDNGPCTFTLSGDTTIAATFNPAGDPFLDVIPGSWPEAYINAIYANHITSGWGGTNEFKPDYAVTREQMAAFIVRAKEGEPASGYCDSASPFTDVPASSWACPYIKRLFELHLTAGYGGTDQYRPELAVTREQMAAFIVRAVEGEPVSGCSSAPFTDVPTTSWACAYIKRLSELGITTGYGGSDRYRPELPVTRAQMAAFIARAFVAE